MEYATGVYEKLRAAGIRTELDHKDEKVGYKIRQAQLERYPSCWYWARRRPLRAQLQ